METKTMHLVKSAFAAALTAVFCSGASAAEATADDARSVVLGWSELKEMVGAAVDATPASVEEVAGRDGHGKFFIVNFKGGGWAIVAGDTRMNPILAHGETGSLDPESDNPILALAKTDVANFALAAARQNAAQAAAATAFITLCLP